MRAPRVFQRSGLISLSLARAKNHAAVDGSPEHLPNGGLLMSATTESFDVDNPAHFKAAQDMAAAMAPLNDLRWPSGRT